MINIPIWLFVILVALSIILLLIIGVSILSYVEYCHYKENKIKKNIERINKENE